MTVKQKIYGGVVVGLVAIMTVMNAIVWAQTHIYYLNGVPYIFPASQGSTGTLLTNNGSGGLSWSPAPTPEGIWAGGAMLSTVNCPSGWTRNTTDGGRYLVITPSGGTNNGTVGSALTNLENRDHAHAGPNHQHAGPSHTHGMSHTHDVDPPNTSSVGPSAIVGTDIGGGGSYLAGPTHFHNTDIGNFASSASSISATAADGTAATGPAGTGSTGGSNVMIAPLKQLILCVKD